MRNIRISTASVWQEGARYCRVESADAFPILTLEVERCANLYIALRSSERIYYAAESAVLLILKL